MRKRWGWLLLTALLGGVAGWAALGSLQWGVLMAGVVLALHAVWIVARSYQRHRDDYLPPLPAES